MIISAAKRLDKFEKNISGVSFLAKKMRREYLSNKDVDINNFYTMDNCALMLMGENLSIRGIPTDEELETILSFCSFMGVYGLETDVPDMAIEAKTNMYLMEYKGDNKTENPAIVKNSNIYGFSEFSCKNFTGSAFSTVYSYFARKVNKGMSDIYYLSENGKIVSGALATKYGDDEKYITFVSTDKKYRNKGYAKQVIYHIVAACQNRKITLMCEEKLLPFYEKLGFVHTDNVYLYTLREENI